MKLSRQEKLILGLMASFLCLTLVVGIGVVYFSVKQLPFQLLPAGVVQNPVTTTTMVTLSPAPTSTMTHATSVPIIIDVPSLFGKSLSEIRATYKIAQYEDLHPLTGYEDVLPNGRLSEGYSDGKYSFYIFYNEKQESVGFQIYDGLESHHLRVSDWREITQMLNLNVTQPPDFINEYRAEWNNHLGYHIEVIRGISLDYVFCVFIAIMW